MTWWAATGGKRKRRWGKEKVGLAELFLYCSLDVSWLVTFSNLVETQRLVVTCAVGCFGNPRRCMAMAIRGTSSGVPLIEHNIICFIQNNVE